MKLKAVFFDLDGTLLPMDLDVFLKNYFGSLAARVSRTAGYDPKKLVDSILYGSYKMVENDGKMSNEDLFWESFSSVYGKDARRDEKYFEEYYHEDFDRSKEVCGYDPEAPLAVKTIKSMGLRLILATNPVFPAIATRKRAEWAGLDVSDFELITSYENSFYSKPNPKYYEALLEKTGLHPSEVLMVGNDVDDDMIAEKLGMNVFLITPCLINKGNADISVYPNGNFKDLIEHIKQNF